MKNAPSFLGTALIALCGGVVAGAVMLTFMPKSSVVYQGGGVGSAAGTVFNSAKIAMINVAWTTSTSTSLYNGDASDRYVLTAKLACTGVGTSQVGYTGAGLTSTGWLLRAATSATALTSTTANSNPNLVFSTSMATGSPWLVMASSTLAVGGFSSTTPWPSGTYLNIFTNATNTASCVVGVEYLAS